MLERISAAIDRVPPTNTFGALSSQFYTLIPHTFGRRMPPLLSNAEAVQRKKDMLCVLRDVVLARELVEKGETVDESDDEEVLARFTLISLVVDGESN